MVFPNRRPLYRGTVVAVAWFEKAQLCVDFMFWASGSKIYSFATLSELNS